MRKILNISVNDIIPSPETVLRGQGIPRHVKPDERTISLTEEAISIFRQKAKPIGLLSEISRDEFENIFTGEGRNEIDSPIEKIYQTSEKLTIFAVTVGEVVCSEITSLFSRNDFALGSLLDSSASEGTEIAAQVIEDFYKSLLEENGFCSKIQAILRFSPGYCGWHISAQKKLFQVLHPEDVDITLNASYLMQPLKSISGVIIAGKKEIFEFEDTFPFCKDCVTHTCRDRINSLFTN